MTIGEKIKQFRQKNGITQERLAEYLNITYQSISKWENNNALPDITLVVPIANFFGVTTDELFDRTSDMQEDEIEALSRRDYDLAQNLNKESIRERVTMWREAVQKYPGNFRCLKNLAWALFHTLDRIFEEREYQQNARELISVCERILRDCTDVGFRESAIQILVYTYSYPFLEVADEEKAAEYAGMASSIYSCREKLLESAHFTEKGVQRNRFHKHHNNLTYMDFLCGNIIHPTGPRTHEESIFALETAIKLWETLIYDGNFLFYHCRLGYYCLMLAKHHAALGHDGDALTWLERSYYHVKAYDDIPADHSMHYTSVWVCEASSSRHPLSSCMEDLKQDMGDPCFDGIRESVRFLELAGKVGM